MFDRLIDHHCHGVTLAALDRAGFEALMSEAHRPGSPAFVSQFDKPLGLVLRRHCAPVLGLEPMASPEAYLARRMALGPAEASRRLLAAAGVSAMLIDSGHRAEEILDCAGMAELAGVPSHEVVRIEAVFEAAAGQGDPLRAFAETLAARAATAVALKSVVAYRSGFAIEQTRPGAAELSVALARWQRACEAGRVRLEDPVLLRHALWVALELAAERRLPIQLHVGVGDRDVVMPRCDPGWFVPFIEEAEARGVPVMLLHCHPFERECAWMAEVWSNVHVDVGFTLNFTGPSALRPLRDLMEMAPFAKQLYSSDAFGLAELHLLGRVQFERALTRILSDWIAAGDLPLAEAERIAAMIAWENAARVYELGQ
ncbi:MAG: amidohydrolase [Paracoccaceae bacterium]|nr:MAG: amidohydrolase [Paracoccaceae bacterium]